MSPIDDELRSLLSDRAAAVSPAPDPLGGIERRAKRMRRNRVAASVAGSALVVAAIAVVVPSVLPDRDDPAIVATQPPSSAPSPSAAALSPAALDPQHPWAYRGDPAVIAGNELVTLRAEWTTRHPGTTLTPLFGQVYEPSAKPEIVFVSTAQGSDRWGIATSSESGWDFLYDEALPFGTKVLMAALPGDEVPRLLVVAAPSTGDISYAPDGSTFSSMTMLEPGISIHALEGDTSRDVVRILDGDGALDNPVFQGPAPDGADDGGAPTVTTPANLLAWPIRGEAPPASTLTAAAADFATKTRAQAKDVETKVLYAGTNSAGWKVVVLQAWLHGNDARTFVWAQNPSGGGKGQLGKVTDERPAVQVAIVPGDGEAPGTLVVVGEPNTAHVRYAGTASAPYSAIEGGGAVMIDRASGTSGDRLQLTTSNGTMIFGSTVQSAICTTMGYC